MVFLRVLFVFSLSLSLSATEESPCPRTFLIDTEKVEEGKWYGAITLNSRLHIKGVVLQIHFDKSVIQLGNYLGSAESNADHTIFTIRNDKKEIKANTPVLASIFVKYDPKYGNSPPQITKITFNGKEICPKYEEDISNIDKNVPAIPVNIDVPQCGTSSHIHSISLRSLDIANRLSTNGPDTTPGQYPWHAAVYTQRGAKEKHYICGGSLISEKHVLTVAHCITQPGKTTPRDLDSLDIILGKYGLSITGKYEQTMKPSNIIIHPEYNRTYYFNDISIVELASKVQFTDYVRPVCLWSEDTKLDPIANHAGTAVGWGLDLEVTDLLMQAEMLVSSTLNCIFSNRDYFAKALNGKNFCAGYGNGTVCNLTSGGGLVFPKTGTNGTNAVWQLRGIISSGLQRTGQKCDPNYLVVLTDVAQYLDWIQKSIS